MGRYKDIGGMYHDGLVYYLFRYNDSSNQGNELDLKEIVDSFKDGSLGYIRVLPLDDCDKTVCIYSINGVVKYLSFGENDTSYINHIIESKHKEFLKLFYEVEYPYLVGNISGVFEYEINEVYSEIPRNDTVTVISYEIVEVNEEYISIISPDSLLGFIYKDDMFSIYNYVLSGYNLKFIDCE